MVIVINGKDIFYEQELKSISVIDDKELILNFTDTSVSVNTTEEDTEMQPIKTIAYKIHSLIYNVSDANHGILDVEELAKEIFVKNNNDEDNNNEGELGVGDTIESDILKF